MLWFSIIERTEVSLLSKTSAVLGPVKKKSFSCVASWILHQMHICFSASVTILLHKTLDTETDLHSQ